MVLLHIIKVALLHIIKVAFLHIIKVTLLILLKWLCCILIKWLYCILLKWLCCIPIQSICYVLFCFFFISFVCRSVPILSFWGFFVSLWLYLLLAGHFNITVPHCRFVIATPVAFNSSVQGWQTTQIQFLCAHFLKFSLLVAAYGELAIRDGTFCRTGVILLFSQHQ